MYPRPYVLFVYNKYIVRKSNRHHHHHTTLYLRLNAAKLFLYCACALSLFILDSCYFWTFLSCFNVDNDNDDSFSCCFSSSLFEWIFLLLWSGWLFVFLSLKYQSVSSLFLIYFFRFRFKQWRLQLDVSGIALVDWFGDARDIFYSETPLTPHLFWCHPSPPPLTTIWGVPFKA